MNDFNKRMVEILSQWGGPLLSEITGISRTQLHRLKSDGNETTRPNLIKISEACDIELLWLLTGEGPMMKDDKSTLQESTAPEFSNDEIEMINLFRSASLQTKMKAFQVLNEDK